MCTSGMPWFIPSRPDTLRTPRGKEALCPKLLAEVATLAEELVEDHFCLGGFWRFLQYEVVLLKELWPAGALASLIRAETKHILPHRRRDFYLILLPEKRLLQMGQGDYLRALLLYVFTHELVHMVRFVRFAASFWMPSAQRIKEEILVHQLTSKILRAVSLPALKEIQLFFDDLYFSLERETQGLWSSAQN